MFVVCWLFRRAPSGLRPGCIPPWFTFGFVRRPWHLPTIECSRQWCARYLRSDERPCRTPWGLSLRHITVTRAPRWDRWASIRAADRRRCNSQSWRSLRTISFLPEDELCYSLRVFTHAREGRSLPRANRSRPGVPASGRWALAAAPCRSTMRSALPGGARSVACPSIEAFASRFLFRTQPC